MTQEQAILHLLRDGPKTTTQIIQAPYGLAAEFRRAISTLRRRGFDIHYHHGKGGSGWYELVSEPPVVEPSGQLAFAP